MNIEAELKKDGIEIIGRLDTLSINSISRNAAEKICKAFPRAHFDYGQLFIEFSRTPMYIAKMPEGHAEATYFYKNSSIYFKAGVPLKDLEKFAIHELIHHIQEVKDTKGNLYRLGLCEYGEFKTYGMALNEGAVQLAASKILEQKETVVKYYDISLPTNSPNCYPLLCNLVNQLAYLVGEHALFESTLFSTDQFKLALIRSCGKKNFLNIQNCLDKVLTIEEKIVLLNNDLLEETLSDEKTQKIAFRIGKLKTELKNAFVQTQNLIYSSYFDNELNRIATTEEIEIYRTKLYDYKNYIGITENYSDFNNYYLDKMIALDDKYEAILNNVALVVVKENTISKMFKRIKNIFGLSRNFERN